MAVDQRPDAGKVALQRAAELVTVLGQLDRMAFHQALEALDVRFQRPRQYGPAFGDLLDLTGHEAVDAGAAFRQLGHIRFQGTCQNGPALGQLADMTGNHFVNDRTGLREFFGILVQGICEAVAAFLQPLQMAAERGVHGRAGLVHLAQIFFQRAGDQIAAFRQLLHLAGDGGVDLGTPVGELCEIGVHGGGHALAALGQLAAVGLDGFLDAGAGLREPCDIAVEGLRDRVARGLHAPGEVVGAGFQHGGGRGDDVGHVGADARLALVDHRQQGLLVGAEGVVDLAGAVDQRLVDLAGAGFQCGVELLGAGIERFGARLELADQCLAALGQRPLDAVKASLEFGTEVARRAAQQRNHAGSAVIQQIGQRTRQSVGGVCQFGDARVEQGGEGLSRGGQAVGDRIQPGLDRIED